MYHGQMEHWKPVVGYEGLYSVSDQGRVRRETTRTRGVSGTIKQAFHDGYGYAAICLSRPGDKQRSRTVHRIVWEAFNGPRPDGMTVNHRDGDKWNNGLVNLELMSIGDNIRHAISELGHSRVGGKNPAAKLSEPAVVTIRELRASGTTRATLAQRFGLSERMVGLITSGRAWADSPGPRTEARTGRPRRQ